MGHIMKRIVGIFIFLLLPLIATVTRTSQLQDTPEPWVTIFIHGIMSIKPHINLKNIIHLFNDKVEGTLYAKSLECMRRDPFFYQNQAMQAIGLEPVDCENKQPGNATGALANVFNEVSLLSCPTNHKNYFYTYGWSGLISHSDRKKAAQDLYASIIRELKERTDIINPRIRVIGYSHGGNVALNMALYHPNDSSPNPISIDELILIGTPIQCENDFLITSDLFKRVYNVYSLADRIQALDCFSTQRFFSRKVFTARKHFVLPDKLIQIQIRAMHTITHPTPNNTHHIELPLNHPSYVSGHARFLREKSPGHTELWFFGWTLKNYRKTFPLYPLPTVALLPFILNNVDTFDYTGPNKSIIADMRPDYEHVILRNENDIHRHVRIPFVSRQKMQELATRISQYRPHKYDKQEMDKHIQCALEYAK
jgi:pimeloyl-ACP methyl ester carboxylesterase